MQYTKQMQIEDVRGPKLLRKYSKLIRVKNFDKTKGSHKDKKSISVHGIRYRSMSRAKKDCLKYWSLIIRQRDRKCSWCSKEENLQAHHIVPRATAAAAGYCAVDNGMTLCLRCHIFLIKQDPDAYIAMRDKWLAERGLKYTELVQKYRKGSKAAKILLPEWLALRELLKEQAGE